ncbi:MAG: hypothetical protein NT028_06950, partial [candidate division Zixibacteria bacterium]|nr:hypothetical protein [candidate division Zixibacteria bacterium]
MADPELQKEVMKKWFLSKYENPVEETPYESAEGGYIYIFGGPYDAADILGSEFAEIVGEKVIEECVSELEDEEGCIEWAAVASEQDYDDEFLKSVTDNPEFYQTFQQSISNIGELLNFGAGATSGPLLNNLLFV